MQVYTDPTPLINCLTECNRNVAAVFAQLPNNFGLRGRTRENDDRTGVVGSDVDM